MFDESNEDDFMVQIDFNKVSLKLLLTAVNYRLEKWPGGNPEEQVNLQYLQNQLRAAYLEYQFLE